MGRGRTAADSVILAPEVLTGMRRLTLTDCPLCGFDCEDRNGLRVHLHGSHLKSELIDVYLDAVGE